MKNADRTLALLHHLADHEVRGLDPLQRQTDVSDNRVPEIGQGEGRNTYPMPISNM